ncbi:MAG: hypothetical protein R3C10_18950 [Pirellulales bacterium]
MQSMGSLMPPSSLSSKASAFSADGKTIAVAMDQEGGGLVRFLSVSSDVLSDTKKNNPTVDNIARFDLLRNDQVASIVEAVGPVTIDDENDARSLTIEHANETVFHAGVTVGEQRSATFVAPEHSRVESQRGLTIGRRDGSTGRVELASRSTLNEMSGLVVGDAGHGTLMIADAARVDCALGSVGQEATGVGEITVVGNGAELHTPVEIMVGENGKGTLNLWQGGCLTSDDTLSAGIRVGSVGELNVTGDKSSLECKLLCVGHSGMAQLKLDNSAILRTGEAFFARLPSAEVQLSVSNGARFVCEGICAIGGSNTAGGSASAVVDAGGQMSVGGSLMVWNWDVLRLDGGTIETESLVVDARARIEFCGGTLAVGGLADLAGLLYVGEAAVENAVDGSRVRVMTYARSEGSFETIEGPPGVRLEPIYMAGQGLDVVIYRDQESTQPSVVTRFDVE